MESWDFWKAEIALPNFPQFTKKFENWDFCPLPCLHILSNGEDGLAVQYVASERRSQLFMIKLAVFKKNVNIIMQKQFRVSLRSGNTVPKHKWGYFTLYKMLLLSGSGCSPRPITSLAICMKRIALARAAKA